MAQANNSTSVPSDWKHLALSEASAADLVLAGEDDLAYRVVCVGKILGPITLVDYKGAEHTFSQSMIQNEAGRLLGHWAKIKGGSSCYDFHCGQ